MIFFAKSKDIRKNVIPTYLLLLKKIHMKPNKSFNLILIYNIMCIDRYHKAHTCTYYLYELRKCDISMIFKKIIKIITIN